MGLTSKLFRLARFSASMRMISKGRYHKRMVNKFIGRKIHSKFWWK